MDTKLTVSKFAGKPGSVVGTKLNYQLTETTQGEMPDKLRQIRRDVKRSTRPDILGVLKPGWNKSVEGRHLKFPDKPMMRENSRFQSIPMYEYNYRSEKLPEEPVVGGYNTTKNKFKFDETRVQGQTSAPVDYTKYPANMLKPELRARRRFLMPVHEDLEDKLQWNQSTAAIVGNERTKLLDTTNNLAKVNSELKNAELLGTAQYRSPYQTEVQRIQDIRMKKKNDMLEHQRMVETYGPDYVDEIKSIEETKERKSSRNNMDVTKGKMRKFKVFEHHGKWEFSKLEECHVWSCCMNSEYDSVGCSYTVISPDAWNYASFNN